MSRPNFKRTIIRDETSCVPVILYLEMRTSVASQRDQWTLQNKEETSLFPGRATGVSSDNRADPDPLSVKTITGNREH